MDNKENPILIVDDDKELLSTLIDTIESMEIFSAVIGASNGVEANLKLQNQEFAVVLSDLHMPKMDGIAFVSNAKKLRREKTTLNTQFIFMTGLLEQEKLKHIMSLKIAQVMIKPFKYERLKEELFEALKKARTTPSFSHVS